MKKILILFLCFICTVQLSIAKSDNKDYSINFNGSKFHLLYSIKNKDFGGYLNEYYKKGETYNIWTELVAVHHFPNAYSPIDRIKDFKDYLGSMHVPSSLTFDDKKNTAMIDFIMISDRQKPIVLEFNIFKYEKSKKCGSIAVQYAKRYSATTTMQIEEIKRDFERNRKQLIKEVKKIEIPAVIEKDIDKCISASNVRATSENEAESAEIASEKNQIVDADKTELKTEPETVIIAEDEQSKSAALKDEAGMGQAVSNNEEESFEQNSVAETNTVSSANNGKEDISTEEASKDTKSTKIEIAQEQQNEQNITNKNVEKEQVAQAPVPAANVQVSKEMQDIKAQKKTNKTSDYILVNSKDKYYAKPRTSKDLKMEVKQKRIEQKKNAKNAIVQAKLEKKNLKIQQKQEKKQAKEDKKEEKYNLKQEQKIAKQTQKINKRYDKAELKEAKEKEKNNKKYEKLKLKEDKQIQKDNKKAELKKQKDDKLSAKRAKRAELKDKKKADKDYKNFEKRKNKQDKKVKKSNNKTENKQVKALNKHLKATEKKKEKK